MPSHHCLHAAWLVEHECGIEGCQFASGGFDDLRRVARRVQDIGHGPVPVVPILRMTEVDLLEIGAVGLVRDIAHDADHGHVPPAGAERLADGIAIAVDPRCQ